LSQAIKAIKEYPVRINNGKEAQKLKGIGQKTGAMIDDNLPFYPPDDPNRQPDPVLNHQVTMALANIGDLSFGEDDDEDILVKREPEHNRTGQKPVEEDDLPPPSASRTKRRASDPLADQMEQLRQSIFGEDGSPEDLMVTPVQGQTSIGTPTKKRREAAVVSATPAATQGITQPAQNHVEADDDILDCLPGQPPMQIATYDDRATLMKDKEAKAYIPGYETGNWAILLTLFNKAEPGTSMLEADLKNYAELYSQHPMWQDPNSPFTAFSNIKRLVEAGYIKRLTNPTRYGLLDSGRILAAALEAERQGGPALAKKTAAAAKRGTPPGSRKSSPTKPNGTASPTRLPSPPRGQAPLSRIPIIGDDEEDNLIVPPSPPSSPRHDTPPVRRIRAVSSVIDDPTPPPNIASMIQPLHAPSFDAVPTTSLPRAVVKAPIEMIVIPDSSPPSSQQTATVPQTCAAPVSPPRPLHSGVPIAASRPATQPNRLATAVPAPTPVPANPASFQPTWRYEPFIPNTTNAMRKMDSYSRDDEIAAAPSVTRSAVPIPILLNKMDYVPMPVDEGDYFPLNAQLEKHTITKIILYVDSREKRRLDIDQNKDYFQVHLTEINPDTIVRSLALTVGDFLWVGLTNTKKCVVLNTIIERKTIFDLASSVIDGRFEEQKWRLRHSGLSKTYYLVEGTVNMDSVKYELPPEKIQSAIAQVAFGEKFTLLRPRDQRDTIRYIHAINKEVIKEFKGKTVYTTNDGAIVTLKVRHHGSTNFEKFERTYLLDEQNLCWTLEQFMAYMQKTKILSGADLFGHQLMGLAGVSPKKAAAIVSRWKSLHHLLTAYQITPTRPDRINLVADIAIGNKKLGIAIGTLVHDSIMGEGF
jgi:ERCC4-type nuclease